MSSDRHVSINQILPAFVVADQLISRVFDQRQFTNGEINYLSREIFEGKTNNLEKSFDKLLKVNESVCLIADTNAPDLCINHEAKAKEISDQGEKLNRLRGICFSSVN